ncbi:preprotein translocase subunit YajC [Ornithinimicrobium sp. F0845]|uniref:preprotein translocase subunit YajC n=1 Tax=Ornithinimicrobium sp. F0845 TaxID=2926412 RepID=UPI001FF50E16|nr:preprotein translocase subunit YajC [Ornithinimicrobium sp. F0845]MCK0111942.1 preprotein translocase subunit YajC [Ornithinimicrobium sp. F0845]
MSPMASATSGGGDGFSTLLLLLPLLLIAYLLFSQRRRQKKLKEMQAGLQIGARVMTTTGLYGTVSHLDESTVYIEAAPGVVLQWDRRAVVPAQDTRPGTDEAPDDTVGEQ